MKKTLLSLAILAAFNANAQNTELNYTRDVLSKTGVPLAWGKGYTGRGVTVGVIDQGFDLSHTDIRPNVLATKNFAIVSYSQLLNNTVTSGTHGTMMASIIAGAKDSKGTVGVAPNAKLLLAQAGLGGEYLAIQEQAVFSSLNWLSMSGAQIINMSFGMNYDSNFIRSVRSNPQGIFFAPAITDNSKFYAVATDRNSILVAAAGNQGLLYSQVPATYAAMTNSTGQLVLGGKMVIVGSVDNNNNIASFSNRAGHICQTVSGLRCLDPVLTRNFFVVAPGVNIVAAVPNQIGKTQNTTGLTSGTSASAAYVSGGLALMKQAWPQMRAEQLVNQLLTTTKDLGAPGVDDTYGRGLVDFDRATMPMGWLRVASVNQSLSGATVPTTAPLNQSAMVGGKGFVDNLAQSSVLKTTQAIDEIGRNYTVNMGRLVVPVSTMLNPESPYLGYVGAESSKLQITDSWSIIPGQTGLGMRHSQQFGKFTFEHTLGHLAETEGFLGNYGRGSLGLGSTTTTFLQTGARLPVRENTEMFINYAQGHTNVVNSPESMIKLSDTIKTDAFRLGLAQFNLLAQGDRLALSTGTPVQIKRGKAYVTGVVGYNYEENADGEFTAHPISRTDTINLKTKREYVFAANYFIPVTAKSALITQFTNNATGQTISLNYFARY